MHDGHVYRVVASQAVVLGGPAAPGEIERVPTMGGVFETMARGLSPARTLAFDAERVYAIDGAARVVAFPKHGGPLATMASGSNITSIAADEAGVFFVSDGRVMRVAS